MPFSMPPNFVNDLNQLGSLIQLSDDAIADKEKSNYLQMAMTRACSALTGLASVEKSLAQEIGVLTEADPAAVREILTEHRQLFMQLEDIILRDQGITAIPRKRVLSTIRRFKNLSGRQIEEFKTDATIALLHDMKELICARAGKFRATAEMQKYGDAVMVYGIVPVNAAGTMINFPLFTPAVFGASVAVGTIVGKLIFRG